nr:hypothetical protein [Tanacetum cinerariifolium]
MIIYLKNMAGYKMEHFKGMTYDKVRPIFERKYNKVQTLFKPAKDVEEPTKKRVAEETLLQESFKKLKAVEVSGFESTQDTPTNDPKEISDEDVQNMLEIVLVSEFKVEALQKYNKVQTLFKPAKDVEEPTKKRVAEETLLQESFKKLKAVEVSGFESTQDTPTNDPKEMSDEDVQNMLEIVLVSEFKVEALQRKITLLNAMMIMMLSAKLQVKEYSEMAKDLVMKIFIEANKPKSRSFNTSSK